MNSHFWKVFVIMLIAQILLCNFGNFSQYLTICFLPVMILMLPVKIKTIPALFIAFLTGLVVDFFSDGMLGLRAAALLPVALVRLKLIGLVFGSGLILREENLSFRKAGIERMTLVTLLTTALSLLIMIMLDTAGTVTLTMWVLKFFISLIASTIVSLFIASFFDAKEVSRWR